MSMTRSQQKQTNPPCPKAEDAGEGGQCSVTDGVTSSSSQVCRSARFGGIGLLAASSRAICAVWSGFCEAWTTRAHDGLVLPLHDFVLWKMGE